MRICHLGICLLRTWHIVVCQHPAPTTYKMAIMHTDRVFGFNMRDCWRNRGAIDKHKENPKRAFGFENPLQGMALQTDIWEGVWHWHKILIFRRKNCKVVVLYMCVRLTTSIQYYQLVKIYDNLGILMSIIFGFEYLSCSAWISYSSVYVTCVRLYQISLNQQLDRRNSSWVNSEVCSTLAAIQICFSGFQCQDLLTIWIDQSVTKIRLIATDHCPSRKFHIVIQCRHACMWMPFKYIQRSVYDCPATIRNDVT